MSPEKRKRKNIYTFWERFSQTLIEYILYIFRKTNMGQKAISFVSPSLWNSLPELILKTDNLNTSKHDVKSYCLN